MEAFCTSHIFSSATHLGGLKLCTHFLEKDSPHVDLDFLSLSIRRACSLAVQLEGGAFLALRRTAYVLFTIYGLPDHFRNNFNRFGRLIDVHTFTLSTLHSLALWPLRPQKKRNKLLHWYSFLLFFNSRCNLINIIFGVFLPCGLIFLSMATYFP